MHPTKGKIEAIKNARTPTNVTELRAFLVMLNYYARFLYQACTLQYKVTKWTWGNKQEAGFADGKSMLQSDTLLVHFDMSKPLILEYDASLYGTGAVLSHVMDDQTERPIGYASRTLTTAENNLTRKDWPYFMEWRNSTPTSMDVRSSSDPTTNHCIISLMRRRPFLLKPLLSCRGGHLLLVHISTLYSTNRESCWPMLMHWVGYNDVLLGELTQLVNHMDNTPISAAEVKEWTEKDPLLSSQEICDVRLAG